MGPIVVGDWHFRSLGLTAEQLLEEIRGLGFDGLEVGLVDEDSPDRENNIRVFGRAESFGLEIGAVSLFLVPRLWPDGALAHPDRSERERALRLFDLAAETAAGLGVKILGLWPGSDRDVPERREEALRLMEESLGEAAAAAERRGLRIALEYKPGDLIGSAESAFRIIDGIGSPGLGLLLDTGHAICGGEDMVRVAKAAGERISYVHLDDNPGDWDRDWPPGRVHDFRPFFQELNRQGYKGALGLDLSAEVFGPDSDPRALCAEGLAYVRQTLTDEETD